MTSRGVAVGVGHEGGVHVEGGRCQRVAEPTRDGAYVDAGCQEPGGDEVAQVMKAHVVEASLLLPGDLVVSDHRPPAG